MVNFVFRSKSKVFQKESNLRTFTMILHIAKPNKLFFSLDFTAYHLVAKARELI